MQVLLSWPAMRLCVTHFFSKLIRGLLLEEDEVIHNLHGYMICSNLQETGNIQTAGTFKPSQLSSSLLCIANLYSKLRKRNAEIVGETCSALQIRLSANSSNHPAVAGDLIRSRNLDSFIHRTGLMSLLISLSTPNLFLCPKIWDLQTWGVNVRSPGLAGLDINLTAWLMVIFLSSPGWPKHGSVLTPLIWPALYLDQSDENKTNWISKERICIFFPKL